MSKPEMIPIFAAVSPNGDIVKSSISTFRVHARRYAAQKKNFSVVKLADINAEITGVKPKIEVAEVSSQIVHSKVEIPAVDIKQKRKYTRRNKENRAA
jgi:hypothetical protein